MSRLPTGPRNRPPGSTLELLEPRQLLHAPELATPFKKLEVAATRTLYVPFTSEYDEPDRVRYSASVSGPGIFSVEFRSGDSTWIRLETSKGNMDFQLFDDVAPDTVRRMTGLIKAGFFDGISFHRLVPGFVIQGGDPAGDGTGGPEFQFDDEFNPDYLFTGTGQLAMANSGKDTNGSQFFITAGPVRFLDFNHTLWGQMVRGADTYKQIIDTPADAQGAPTTPVIINRASIIRNRTDAVLIVRATAAAEGQTRTITVTANSDEGATTRTFRVTGTPDSTPGQFGQPNPNNTPPALKPISDFTLPRNTSTEIDLDFVDPDSTANQVEFAGELLDQNLGNVVVNNRTRKLTFTPKTDYSGPVRLLIGVKQLNAQDRGSTQNPFDSQIIQIGVGEKKVAAASGVQDIDGSAGATTSNVVVATFTDSDPAPIPEQWSASIDWGDGRVSAGRVARNDDGSFSVFGDHDYRKVAVDFPITVTLTGNKGARRIVTGTLDTRNLASFDSGLLVVNGSGGDDVVGLSLRNGVLRANVNGVIRAFSPSDIRRIEIYAFDGHDTVTVGAGIPAVYIDGAEGNDHLSGGAAGDTISGGAGRNTLFGGAGNDRINGSGGRDLLYGQEGDDRIYGNAGDDTLDGGGNVDRLFGGDGNDLLLGGGGNDKLRGEAGDDLLNGGAGSDLGDTLEDTQPPISVEVLE